MDDTVRATVGGVEIIESDGKYRFREEGGAFWEVEISAFAKSPEDAFYEASLSRRRETADDTKSVKRKPKRAK